MRGIQDLARNPVKFPLKQIEWNEVQVASCLQVNRLDDYAEMVISEHRAAYVVTEILSLNMAACKLHTHIRKGAHLF